MESQNSLLQIFTLWNLNTTYYRYIIESQHLTTDTHIIESQNSLLQIHYRISKQLTTDTHIIESQNNLLQILTL